MLHSGDELVVITKDMFVMHYQHNLIHRHCTQSHLIKVNCQM